MSLTAELRDELAHLPPASAPERLAEASALLRCGGALHLRGTGASWTMVTPAGAVARRLHQSLRALLGVRPEIEVHQPAGIRSETRYHVRVETGLDALGLLDERRRPVEGLPQGLVAQRVGRLGYLRGAVMAAGSVSDPRHAAHLEIRAPGPAVAEGLATLLTLSGSKGARASQHADDWRVVLKSGEEIAALLAQVGATAAATRFDRGRLQRQWRSAANRGANADRANLSRTVTAATRQVAAIEDLVAREGWEAIPEDLRPVALARLANPGASLAELGALLDPPRGKVAVHRLLTRLTTLGDPDRG